MLLKNRNTAIWISRSVTLVALFAAGLALHPGGQPALASPGPDRAINAAELKQLMETDPRLSIVDVRTPEEFTGPLGHLPDARNIPLDQLAGHITELDQPNQTLVLVCRTQRRSAMGATLLQRSGISNVLYLNGGMKGWRETEAAAAVP